MRPRQSFGLCLALVIVCGLVLIAPQIRAGTTQKRYYAHDTVEDKHGVIAPWYRGLNGQCDFRIRIAAETLKRYPWTDTTTALAAVPEYVFTGHWAIANNGTITIPPLRDWDNGDLGQRAAYVLSGLVDYYRYSGDPAAIAHLTYQADALLDYCQTPPDHPWPNFLISVPVKGKVYGQCDPHGMIQLDIVAEVGLAMLRAYQLTGNVRWLDAAKHWGDVLAEKRDRRPGAPPWGRYANPEDTSWRDNKQTGGVVFLLCFLDELLRLGYKGQNDSIVQARDAGRAYLRDVLLPAWTVDDTWGRNYWDWPDPVQAENVTEFSARYLMDNKGEFPNWRNDVRNILSLFLNRTSVNPASKGEVYSGAWAFPESSGCCGRSLWYPPMELAVAFAQYGVEADSEWARELARRMQILTTYDGHETGVSEDNIDGGFVVNNGWFKIAHPMALKHLLATTAWMPEIFGPSRENHIMRTSSVVASVVYGKGKIVYSTFDAPSNSLDVLRLGFSPSTITADGKPLGLRPELDGNGYVVKKLSNGDCIVSIRHDGCRKIVVEGDDPQRIADDGALAYQGEWEVSKDDGDLGGGVHASRTKGSAMSFSFTGSQVRLLGRADVQGGLADVYVDGVKQLVGIDCWNPSPRHQQVLYYRNGLSDGEHALKIVARGNGNPRSSGANVYVDSIQWSATSGSAGNGEGGGPTDTQRMVLGYTAREDYTDRTGNTWRPATEVVTPLRVLADSVVKTWWTAACPETIADTRDPDLYRYGLHAREFVVNVTVGPGKYHVRLKFAATRKLDCRRNCVTVLINGERVAAKMDVAATAGGPNKAVDLVFNDISPRNGVVDIRFVGGDVANGVEGEAFAQAIEVGPGDGGSGANPICVGENLLNNPGFEEGVPDSKVTSSGEGGGHGWSYRMEGQGRGCVSAESSWADKPVLGAPEPCSEDEAVRVYSEGNAVTTIYQDAPVSPNSKYTASVFVRARDLDGRGFGQTPGDSAGVRVVEMDASGKVVADHPKAAVTEACPYTYLSTTFTTTANTAKVRFMLETKIGCDRTHGSVTYDGCALDGPPMACILTGKVVHKGKALPGAQVTIGDKVGTTDAEGAYKVAGVPCVRRPLQVRVSKTGCYPEEKWVVMASGVNTANFELIGPPANNLLVNPGFEDGVSQYLRGGPLEGHGWKYITVPGNSVIYPESEYTQHRSLGCPEFHSGKEAVRVSSTNGNDRISLYQDVPVAPNAYYVASVFVRTRDIIQGEGFGKGKSDSAGLHIQELDAEGKVVADHPKAEVNRMTNYRCVWLAFTTTPATKKVRFSLDTVIACKWVQGNVTYDDCALDGPAASAPQ